MIPSKKKSRQRRPAKRRRTVYPERTQDVKKLYSEARSVYGDTKLDVQLGLIFQMLHGIWTHLAIGRYADQNESEELKAFCAQFDSATNFFRKEKAA